jgi:hypothetical protein
VRQGGLKQFDPNPEPLFSAIDFPNELFRNDLKERDQLLFDKFEEIWLANPEVFAQAQNNELKLPNCL